MPADLEVQETGSIRKGEKRGFKNWEKYREEFIIARV